MAAFAIYFGPLLVGMFNAQNIGAHTKQQFSAECGLVCLAAMSEMYSTHDDPLPFLRDITTQVSSGLNLQKIMELSFRVGLSFLPIEASLDELETCGKPSIALFNSDHFVIFIPTSKNKSKIKIFDPNFGIVYLAREEFLKKYSNKALLVNDNLDQTQTMSTKDKVGRLSILKLFSELKIVAAPILFFSGLTTLLSMVSPIFMQIGIDEIVTSGNVKFLFALVGVFLFVAVFTSITTVLGSFLIATTERNITAKLQMILANRIGKLSYKSVEGRSQGDLLTDFRAAEQVTRFLSSGAVTSIAEAFFSFVFLSILFFYSWKMALLVLMSGLLVSSLRISLIIFERPIEARILEKSAKTDGNFFDMLSHISQTKIFNVIQSRFHNWARYFLESHNTEFKLIRFQIWADASYEFLQNILNVIIGGFGIYLIIKGELTIGGLYLVVRYKDMFQGKLGAVVEAIRDWLLLDISIDRFAYILEEATEEPIGLSDASESALAIDAKNLSYKYDATSDYVLKNLNLTIKHGEKVLIAGPSGEGKTTLLKVLVGLYHDFEGTLFIRGVRVTKESIADIRKFTSGTFQGQTLCDSNIEENIKYYDSKINHSTVVSASETAQIWDVIKKLPMQEKTPAGADYGPLSSGQKQRVLIARAVAKQSDVLFLDEGTANLDAKTEANVVKNIEKISQTVIMITHRIESFANFDRFLWLEDSTVEEINHKEMLEKGRCQ